MLNYTRYVMCLLNNIYKIYNIYTLMHFIQCFLHNKHVSDVILYTYNKIFILCIAYTSVI